MFQRIQDGTDSFIDFPEDVPLSEACKDLITGLLKKDQTQRLGQAGPVEIMGHEFFEGLDF